MANNKYFFVVQTMEVLDGKKLRSFKPDADGYYTKVPVSILGVPTRTKVTYLPDSMVAQIQNPQSGFNLLLRHGNLFGEWGHPITKDLERTAVIDEKCISHHFRKVETGPTENGGTLVLADVKPFGPYKDYLRESLEDPSINTAFSIRTICQQSVDRLGNLVRDVKLLITFDAVAGPGFGEASKRYAPGNEAMDVMFEVTRGDFYTAEGTPAVESYTDERILEIFGGEVIKLKQEVVGLHFPGEKSILSTDGMKRSLMHSMLSKR